MYHSTSVLLANTNNVSTPFIFVYVFQYSVACSAGVFFERAICSRKRHVEISRREEEMGRVKGSGEGAGRVFSPHPSPFSFFRPRTYRKGYYFYSPQSSTVIKSKTAATTILRTRKRFRPPKIRLHCRLPLLTTVQFSIVHRQKFVTRFASN